MVYCFSNLRLRDREADRAAAEAEQIPEVLSDDDADRLSEDENVDSD